MKHNYYKIIATVRGTVSYRLREIFNASQLNYSTKVVKQSDGRKIEFATIVDEDKKEEVINLINANSPNPVITILPVLEYNNPFEYQEVKQVLVHWRSYMME